MHSLLKTHIVELLGFCCEVRLVRILHVICKCWEEMYDNLVEFASRTDRGIYMYNAINKSSHMALVYGVEGQRCSWFWCSFPILG